MKAVMYCDYGIANLKLQEIEKPMPADDQVLVRVHATSLNPLDGHSCGHVAGAIDGRRSA